MGWVYNRPEQNKLRRKLRNNMPQPELILWQYLRGKKLGVKFRRQFGIGPYVVDFFCKEKRLVIELDGDSHFSSEAMKKDAIRDEFLKNKLMNVLRFSNLEVTGNVAGVLERIHEAIE